MRPEMERPRRREAETGSDQITSDGRRAEVRLPDPAAASHPPRRADPAGLPPRCPDCGAVPAPRVLDHEDDCPLGEAIDAVCAADAQWFADHPGAARYWRDAYPSELAELAMAGYPPPAGRVRVAWLGPGMRARQFGPDHGIVDAYPAGVAR